MIADFYPPGFAGLVVAGGLIPKLRALTRDAALLALARHAAALMDQSATVIHELLRTREALGPTGFGGGAAIPHARLPGLRSSAVVVARLAEPIDWGATDGDLVDVVVLLLSPQRAGADHLKALARISRTLRDPATLPLLRNAPDTDAMLLALASETAVAA